MASPTIELGLGGSFIGAVAAEVNVAYWAMQSNETFDRVPPTSLGTSLGPLRSKSPSNLLVLGSVPVANQNLPSQLPEGGYAIQLNGTSHYLVHDPAGPFQWGPLIEPFSIEVVVTLSAVPAPGVEPAVMGNSPFAFTYRNDGDVYAYHNGASFANFAVAAGSRVHLVMTRAGTATDSIIFYVNGVNRGSITPARVSFQVDPIYFGKHWTNAHYLSATYEFVATYFGELSAARVLAHYNALAWTDVTADTSGAIPCIYERGIRNDQPTQRVASTGTLTFALNNLGSNSGGVTGYYSPGHASVRAGFRRGIPARVKVGADIQFVGRVRSISPSPGRQSGGHTKVFATDFMDRAATFLLEGVAPLSNYTGNVVARYLLRQIPHQPHGSSLATGSETYTVILDNSQDEKVTALQEFHRLAVSELGYIYLRRTGMFVYENRQSRIAASPTSVVTLADTMHGIDVADVSAAAINSVQITVHPRVIDAAATTVLFAIVNAFAIASAETKTIIGPYRNPSSPGITSRVGGLSMVTPVITTDYVMNTAADGSGVDLTSSLEVTANYGANGVQFVLTNTATQPAHVTKLQCRGKGVYDFRTIVVRAQNAVGVAEDGLSQLTFDMVYQENVNVAQSMADALLSGYGDLTGTRVRRVEILPDAAGVPANLLLRDISDRVTVSETITGATGDYFINGVKHEFQNGTLPKVTWWLTPASSVSFLILDLVGASELDSNAILAPG